jgi:hypothetical protein
MLGKYNQKSGHRALTHDEVLCVMPCIRFGFTLASRKPFLVLQYVGHVTLRAIGIELTDKTAPLYFRCVHAK